MSPPTVTGASLPMDSNTSSSKNKIHPSRMAFVPAIEPPSAGELTYALAALIPIAPRLLSASTPTEPGKVGTNTNGNGRPAIPQSPSLPAGPRSLSISIKGAGGPPRPPSSGSSATLRTTSSAAGSDGAAQQNGRGDNAKTVSDGQHSDLYAMLDRLRSTGVLNNVQVPPSDPQMIGTLGDIHSIGGESDSGIAQHITQKASGAGEATDITSTGILDRVSQGNGHVNKKED